MLCLPLLQRQQSAVRSVDMGYRYINTDEGKFHVCNVRCKESNSTHYLFIHQLQHFNKHMQNHHSIEYEFRLLCRTSPLL